MVKRSDGKQVGVEPTNTPLRLTQRSGLAIHGARSALNRNDLGVGVPKFFMVIGVLGTDTSSESSDEPVLAVQRTRDHVIRYIITDAAFGSQAESNEGDDTFPYEMTWQELINRGMLGVGRFEKATQSDIQWYFDYCADNERWPASNISFPSAEGPGPDGRQGGYREGKAVAITHL